jgi:hypothetical protein
MVSDDRPHSSDSEKFFHISITQSEPQFEIHCLKDNRFWKSVTLIHPVRLWFEPKLNHCLLNQVNATEPAGRFYMKPIQPKAKPAFMCVCGQGVPDACSGGWGGCGANGVSKKKGRPMVAAPVMIL